LTVGHFEIGEKSFELVKIDFKNGFLPSTAGASLIKIREKCIRFKIIIL